MCELTFALHRLLALVSGLLHLFALLSFISGSLVAGSLHSHGNLGRVNCAQDLPLIVACYAREERTAARENCTVGQG